jgi:hypothetical protein
MVAVLGGLATPNLELTDLIIPETVRIPPSPFPSFSLSYRPDFYRALRLLWATLFYR